MLCVTSINKYKQFALPLYQNFNFIISSSYFMLLLFFTSVLVHSFPHYPITDLTLFSLFFTLFSLLLSLSTISPLSSIHSRITHSCLSYTTYPRCSDIHYFINPLLQHTRIIQNAIKILQGFTWDYT